LAPDKPLFATEAAQHPPDIPDHWWKAELYAMDIIGDMNNWAVAWTDWNLLLNIDGGPRHTCAILKGCGDQAPIIADVDKQALIFQPHYYYFGQISKFVPPGSTKIHVEIKVTSPLVANPPFWKNGGDILTSFCNGGSPQQWNFKPNNALPQMLVTSKIQDVCVTLPAYIGGSVQILFSWDGTITCNQSDPAQLWIWNDNGQIVNSKNGKCLEATTVNKVVRQGYDWVDLLECSQSPNQKWVSNQADTILNVGTGRCLEATGSLIQSTAFKTEKGEIVVVVENVSDNDVSFKLKYGSYASLLPSPAHSIQTYIWPSIQ